MAEPALDAAVASDPGQFNGTARADRPAFGFQRFRACAGVIAPENTLDRSRRGLLVTEWHFGPSTSCSPQEAGTRDLRPGIRDKGPAPASPIASGLDPSLAFGALNLRSELSAMFGKDSTI